MSSNSSGDQTFDGVFDLGGGGGGDEVCKALISSKDVITSFMAFRNGEGVMWLPLGDGGTGVIVPLLPYPRCIISSGCGEGARLV